jgi:two-component system response regulator VicR
MSKLIVYIEDDKDMVDLVDIILQRHGYKVVGFLQSEGVVEEIERLEPDLILLDIMMPHVDGFEVYHQLKEREKLRNIPVVVISAMKKAVEEIEQEGKIMVEGCLVKPFSINDLVNIINKALSD